MQTSFRLGIEEVGDGVSDDFVVAVRTSGTFEVMSNGTSVGWDRRFPIEAQANTSKGTVRQRMKEFFFIIIKNKSFELYSIFSDRQIKIRSCL